MSDEVEKEVVQEPAEALYTDDEIDVFVDNGPAPDSDQAKLITELKAKQAELQAQVDPVNAMKSAIKDLGGAIAPPTEKVDVRVAPAGGVADWNAYKENFNAKVFEDPFQMVTDLVSKATEMQSASTANQNLAYSKRIVQIDPATASHYKKWSDEIEREVAKMPVSVRASNPDVYADALKIVKANHIDELIEERLAAERSKNVAPAIRPIAYSESGNARPAVTGTPSQRQQVRISESKMREISAYAEEWGIPEEAAIRLYQKRNML